MNTDAVGRAMITRFEGCVLEPYEDVAGIRTVGVGHVIRPGDPTGPITQAEADALLANDLRVVDACLASNLTGPVGQNQWNAMASLAFNIGCGAFIASSVRKFVNGGDFLAAADAFLLWDKATVDGKLVAVPSLLARRRAERACFLKDVSTLDA